MSEKKEHIWGDFNLAANGKPSDGIPFSDRNIINMQREDFTYGAFPFEKSEQLGSRAVNFQYILMTGVIPSTYWNRESKISDHNQMINFDSDDAFTRSLDKIQTESQKRILADSQLSGLLEKKEWSREDRVLWEKKTSKIVSDEVDKIKGLDTYRLEDGKGTRRAIRLNDLAADIENDTKTIEFDCESMSAVEGVTLQRLENKFLPEDAPQNDYKKQSNYFRAGGSAVFNAGDKPGGHAFIVSSATGNVIEATAHDSQYKEAVNPNYSFDDFATGKLTAYGEKADHYYGGYADKTNGISQANIEKSEKSLKQDTLTNAENKTQLFLEKVKALDGVEGMDQLKEAVASSRGSPQIDPHLREMIEEMVAQPDKAQALSELKDSYRNMTKSWDTTLKAGQNDPEFQQKIKTTFNQYAPEIKSSLQNVPGDVGSYSVMTYADYLDFWKSQAMYNIPDQAQSTQTVIANNSLAR
jgi:hypothetical protein